MSENNITLNKEQFEQLVKDLNKALKLDDKHRLIAVFKDNESEEIEGWVICEIGVEADYPIISTDELMEIIKKVKEEDEPKVPFELFGYECGEGWWPLIKEAQQAVDEWNKQHQDGLDTWGGEKLEFTQVKEKWGLLNIYLNFYPDKLYDKMMELEKRSAHYCEHCGSQENVTTEWTHNWIMTLCPECRKKELERFENIYKK